jgi:uncharacterized protein
MPGFSSWAADGRLKTLVLAVLILSAVALAMYSYYTYKQTRAIFASNTISVSGKGEVFAKPDIATFTFAVEAEAVEAADAQDKSAQDMNAIVEYLKGSGIEDKDIKTSGYSLNPKYRYEQGTCTQWACPPGKQILEGYTVNQMVSVKVRETGKAGDLISGVGTKGATNISGLSFTIDDDQKLKADARDMAIKDARKNAERLAGSLGVRLGRMTSFFENDAGGPIPMYASMDASMGGMAKNERAAIAPSIPTGENTITSNVSIVYEIW